MNKSLLVIYIVGLIGAIYWVRTTEVTVELSTVLTTIFVVTSIVGLCLMIAHARKE